MGQKLNMKQTLATAMLTVYVIAFAGCRVWGPDADLVGTLWTLQSMEEAGSSTYRLESSTTVTIQFSETNRLEGRNFCNGYFGSFALSEDNEIRLDSLGTSLANCRLGDKDGEYYKALHSVQSYRINGNTLRLNYGSGSVLKYLYDE